MNKNDKHFINDLNKKISNITGKKKASEIEWVRPPFMDQFDQIFDKLNHKK